MTLSAAELTSMRVDVARLLPDTCIIQEFTNVSDGQGGGTALWAPAGTVACRMDSMSGQESNVGATLQPFSAFTLTVPFDTDISELSRVSHGGYDYNVIAVDYDKSWPVVLRAHVERV